MAADLMSFLQSNGTVLFHSNMNSFDAGFQQSIRDCLSTGGSKILKEPNAGGSSVVSEAYSFELFHRLCEAVLSEVRGNIVLFGPCYVSKRVL